jgi:hypothetical protein
MWLEVNRFSPSPKKMCRTGADLYACESISIFPHTNEFIGKCFGDPQPAEPCFGPKWGRWVYEKARVEIN